MTQMVLWRRRRACATTGGRSLIGASRCSSLVARRRLRDPEVRFRVDRWLVTSRLIAGLSLAKVEMARFSRTLGTLLSNGVTLVTALGIVRETMGNTWLAEAVRQVGRELKEGRGLGRPMMETGRFPMLAVHMIQVGEETGRLDDMLMQVAETYDREVEVAITQDAGAAAAADDRAHGRGHRLHHLSPSSRRCFRSTTCRSSTRGTLMKPSASMPRRQRGFTILEIVIVFVLIGGMLAFVGPKIYSQMGQAQSQERA